MNRIARLALFALGLSVAAYLVFPRREVNDDPAMTAARSSRDLPLASENRRTKRDIGNLKEQISEISVIELAKKPLPRSLQDTEVDGGLAADSEGHLIVAPGVRALFDYFLSATGEEPADVIRARILNEIQKRLPASAQGEAVELLDQYMAYRERTRELFREGMADDLDARLQQIRGLRREVFGDEHAEALFGAEEAQDYVAAAQAAIAKNTALPEDERKRQIEELEKQYPEEIRLAREEVLKPLRYSEEYATYQQRGASPGEVRQLRERYFGPEAANRLEELDREDQQWDERMTTYRVERQKIESNSSLANIEKERLVEDLRRRRFTDEERVRVDALDRMEPGEGTVAESEP